MARWDRRHREEMALLDFQIDVLKYLIDKQTYPKRKR
jgi:hypothetical protein